MRRPRWHDWIIVLSLVALGAAGIGALWGHHLESWFAGEERPSEADEDTPAPTGGGRML